MGGGGGLSGQTHCEGGGRFTCSRKCAVSFLCFFRRRSVGVTLQKNNVRRDRLIALLPLSAKLWVSGGRGAR